MQRRQDEARCPSDLFNTIELEALLEREIERARVAMTEATDPELRRQHFEEMRELISQRSPQQIQRMEEAKGLR
jgi:hypothetical protein